MADCAVTSSDPAAGFRAALARDPFDAAALRGLGQTLLQQRRPAEAAALLDAATDLAPDADALTAAAAAFQDAGLTADAETRLRRALDLNPAHLTARVLLAGLLRGTGRLADAAAELDHAERLHPGAPDITNERAALFLTRGNAACQDGDLVAGEAWYRQSVAARPDDPAARINLGNALALQGRLADAKAAYHQALAIAPDSDAAAFALSLVTLQSGDLTEGYRLYEHRRQVPGMVPHFTRRPAIPSWRDGQSLAGRHVLVASEQGAGDVIQCARYLPALARIAASVVLEAPWPMHGLFAAMPGVGGLVGLEDAVTGRDIQIPIMSLPLLLGTEAGAPPPYIAPVEERQWRWQAWLDGSWMGGADPGRRIGLVCSGDPRHPRDGDRSIPLAAFADLLETRDATFVLMQTQVRDADWAFLDDADTIRCPGAALTDWADTAALLSKLDLLITVDTAVAHLAGAIGLPVWTLLPFCPDWRWPFGDETTPLYPSMRLYRQATRGNWAAVIDRVRNDLAKQR